MVIVEEWKKQELRENRAQGPGHEPAGNRHTTRNKAKRDDGYETVAKKGDGVVGVVDVEKLHILQKSVMG